MNLKALIAGLSIFVFLFLSIYLYNNMSIFQSKSSECIVSGGMCVSIGEGCALNEMIEHPEGICYLNNGIKLGMDDTKICCVKY